MQRKITTKQRGGFIVGKIIDMTGKKFNRLTVIEISHRTARRRYFWRCLCDCGNETIIVGDDIRSGHTKSCGCLLKESTIERRTTHHLTHTPTYNVWIGLRQRCADINGRGYKNYGGRGITFSDEWLSFENFYKDMGDKPKGLSLDRIDNDGNYCKENCRWATSVVQNNNRRNSKNKLR